MDIQLVEEDNRAVGVDNQAAGVDTRVVEERSQAVEDMLPVSCQSDTAVVVHQDTAGVHFQP